MNKEIKFRDNMPLEEQANILAKFMLKEFGDLLQDEGAIEFAIKLLNEYKYKNGVIGELPTNQKL